MLANMRSHCVRRRTFSATGVFFAIGCVVFFAGPMEASAQTPGAGYSPWGLGRDQPLGDDRQSYSSSLDKYYFGPLQTYYKGGQPLLVLGGNLGGGWSRNTYSDFPTFNGSGAAGGLYGAARFYVQPNFFVGPEGGFMLLDINARNSDTAFGFVRTAAYVGGQAGVTVQGPGASKINIYTGVDANWSRVVVGVEAADERMSKTLGAGWSVHGGAEVQPVPSIPTMWLGLDLRHSDVSGTIGGDPTHVRWNMLTVTLSFQH
jgi:hypothetical protein